MITKKTALSINEISEYMDKEKNSEMIGFVKKFSKLKPEKAKELRKKLEELKMIKLNRENISKLLDVLPEEKESLNKTISDLNLDENETNTILETIKEFK